MGRTDVASIKAQSDRLTGPQPGQKFVHYKGHQVRVLRRCLEKETLKQVVVYCCPNGDECCCTLDEWNEIVTYEGHKVPRFSREVSSTAALNEAARKGFNS